ncbi:hypothetical protein BD779DRAFT_593990 [Infundibulicybe gibba]|nr:hypothetical protein BD779DRAFT_593990 [Infundibulicybe gibba]
MAGANYMGGRRNAAKTRSKDLARRTQKGFFNRQRMDILSKGLTGAKMKTRVSNSTIGLPERRTSSIELAHAKNKIHPAPQDDLGSIISRSDPPTSPESRRRPRSPSKVLEALDTSDSMCRRAAFDRILDLPDLAGLSGRQRRPEARIYPSSQSKQPFFYGNPKKQKHLSSPVSEHHVVTDHKSSSHPKEALHPHHIPPNKDFSGHECGYARAEETDHLVAGESSELGECSLPECSEIDPARCDSLPCSSILLESEGSSETCFSGYYQSHNSSSLGLWDSERSHTLKTKKYSPKQVVLDWYIEDQDPSWPPNHLFGKKDPWHSLGVILGLSPDSSMSSDPGADRSGLTGQVDILGHRYNEGKIDLECAGDSSPSGLQATLSASSPRRLSCGSSLRVLEGSWELIEGSGISTGYESGGAICPEVNSGGWDDDIVITSLPGVDKMAFLEPQRAGGPADDLRGCASPIPPSEIILSNMGVSPSHPAIDVTFRPLPEVNGIFYGPCLFNEVDDSDHED